MKKLVVGAFALLTLNVTAQDTWQQVYSLFQAKCTIGCHGNGGTAGSMDLYGGGDASVVYNNIVDVTPVNPTAAGKEYKRIYPGHPEKSFLLRKCSYTAWDNYYPIEASEGNSMPDGQPVLEKEEVELIRQWILHGAKETGTQVDPQVLYDYYHVNGKPRIAAPPAPVEGDGFQLKMGPFFLSPLEEIEFFKKQDVHISDSIFVNKLSTVFNDESHHFIIYKFPEGMDAGYPAGLRNINDVNGSSLGDNNLIATWQDTFAYELPENTAFKWGGNQVLDLNYHIMNYDDDSIIAAETYVNIYTQPIDTNTIEMFSNLIPINAVEFILGNGMFGQDLIIPNDGLEHTFTYRFGFPFYPQAPTWHIWSIQAHTHSRGKDFDMYKSTLSGQKGEQFYEGFYNEHRWYRWYRWSWWSLVPRSGRWRRGSRTPAGGCRFTPGPSEYDNEPRAGHGRSPPEPSTSEAARAMGAETEPMPNLLTFLCFRPRALLLSMAAAGSLAAMGCVGYHPGGNLQSEDTFTYWSTPHMPQTVTLVDTRTNEKMWTYEIPVGKELVMKFYKNTAPGEHLSDSMRWEVMDVEKTSGPLDNVLPVPDQFSRRVDVEVRPTPEQPPADAEASAAGSMGAAGGAK